MALETRKKIKEVTKGKGALEAAKGKGEESRGGGVW